TTPQTYPTPLPMRPQHAGSPYPANRSPAMTMQQPHINGPPMQPQGAYGGYPQQFNPQQVDTFPAPKVLLSESHETAQRDISPTTLRLQLTASQTQSMYGMHQQQLDPTYGYYPHFMH